MDQKSQNHEKNSLLKRLVTPQQRVSYWSLVHQALFDKWYVYVLTILFVNCKQKLVSSDGITAQDKLEATKRKLQERYQQAEKG